MPFRTWLLKELFRAYMEARKGKRGTADEHVFELNWYRNLVSLRDDLITGDYRPSRGIQFDVYRPVAREIFAAPFRDRVVHHFLYNMSGEWHDRRFIRDSYSCRKGKGTLDGILRLRHHIRSASDNYQKEAYIIKCDIKSYFMSMKRSLLFEAVSEGLEKQFGKGSPMCDFLMRVWKEIIMDDPVKGVHTRGSKSLRARAKVPPEKRLCNQPPGQGIVIGNLTSQLLSNIFLNSFDWYVTKKLGYEHYGRYVDDFYIIVKASELPRALRDIEKMRAYLLERKGLTMHPKKFSCQEVKKGAEFLGAVIYPKCIVPSRRFRRSFYNAAAAMGIGKKDAQSFMSYIGHGKYMSMKGINSKAARRMEWEFGKYYSGMIMWCL